MKSQAISLGVLALSATLGLVAAQDRPAREPDPAQPAGQAAPQREREPDVRAIADLFASFVKAYNAKDAATLGELFTPAAEIEGDDGEVTKGRDAIVARFTGTFKENGNDTLAVHTESLRFIGAEVAIEDGTASLSTGAEIPPRSNHYSVIYARQGGRWLHALIRDEPEPDLPARERLKELEWMLGEWVNESDDEVVFTSCKWSEDGNFLLRDFDVKIEGSIALSGTQRIAWDPQREQFRMWVFDDSGGFAEGMMSRDGERWVVKGSGVRSDGQSVSFTTAISILDKDHLRWEVLDRTIGGKAAPDTDSFDVVRRPPDPGK